MGLSNMMPFWRNFASLFYGARALLVCVMFLTSFLDGYSHEVRPAIVDFKIGDDGGFDLVLKINLESWLADIGADHIETSNSPNADKYDRLRQMQPGELRKLFDGQLNDLKRSLALRFGDNIYRLQFLDAEIPAVGDSDLARDSVVRFNGVIPDQVNKVSWQFDQSASVFRVEDESGKGQENTKVSLYVQAGQQSEQVNITSAKMRGVLSDLVEYIKVGFYHIIPKGLDHILFVAGLFLLSTKMAPLLWQITAFTIAHSVTLGLGMAGIFSVPANIVEPLIAASIIYVGVENIFMDRLSLWRPLVVFLFGLLHGLGFAAVLRDFGLGSGNYLAGLIGFNLGVELGQLSVIAGCFLLVGFWFGRKHWYRQRVTIPASIVIATIGGWWFYERVLLA